MSAEKLYPCPFCGGPGIISKSAGSAPYYGVCCDGDCLTFFDCRAETEAYAIERWNTRHVLDRGKIVCVVSAHVHVNDKQTVIDGSGAADAIVALLTGKAAG